MAGRVIVVGSVNVDLVVTVPTLPTAGETVAGGAFARHHGGKSANQAVAAARLGVPTSFVGAVGDDPFGAEARAALVAEGVDIGPVRIRPGLATGVALILVDARGENLIAVASGANATLSADDVSSAFDLLEPGPGDVVLVGHEVPTGTVRAALRAARVGGSRTVLNPAPATGLDRETWGLADVLVPNRTELAQLVAADADAGPPGRRGSAQDADPGRHAARLLGRGADGDGVAEAVVVTLGGAGAIVVTHDGARRVPAPVVPVVDTVGAGDAFAGALAASLAEGRHLDDAVRRAVTAGSLATTRAGAREGMPRREELEAALADGTRQGRPQL